MNSDEKKFEFLNKELLRIRKEKKLSQEMLAEKVGVSRQSIHLWETGRIIPDYENVINLCNVLNINPSEIINGFNIVNDESKIESKTQKYIISKFLKIIILLFLLILIIFLIKRFIVIIDINNSVKKYKELDNYTYKIISYDMVNNKVSNLVQEEISFKDGLYIRTHKENNKEKFMVLIDYNKIEGENINYAEGTTRKLSKEEIQSVDRIDDVYELREGAIETKNVFTTIILILNPQIKISVKDNYIIEYENGLGKVKVWINKDTGLISNKVYEEDDKTVFKEYDYKI